MTERERAPAPRLPTGTVEPHVAGAPWWKYQPVDAAPTVDTGTLEGARANVARSVVAPAATQPVPRGAPRRARVAGHSGAAPAAVAALAFGTLVVLGRVGAAWAGEILVPVIGLALASAFGTMLLRRHPDEPWIKQFLVWGVAAKLFASWGRYMTITVGYDGGGDSSIYHKIGKEVSEAWIHGTPHEHFEDLRKTNFVRWFTAVVYYVIGADYIVGFLVYGLLAFVGSYLWYRATVESVPWIEKRLYFALVLFAPSLLFWPSAIGKDALMQLGIGIAALGVAHLLQRRIVSGLLIALPGCWLLWAVRPHLLAIVALAATTAFVLGRPSRDGGVAELSIARPVGSVILALLLSFALSQGAKGLGMQDLSLNSVQEELDQTTVQTAQGGSAFDNGGNSLSPLNLPGGMVIVFLRPFIWEVDNSFQIIAALESSALIALIFMRWKSVRLSLRHLRTTPFLLFCWTMVIVYAATFSSLGNFGLLVRQRSIALPALFVILAIDPAWAAADRRASARRR